MGFSPEVTISVLKEKPPENHITVEAVSAKYLDVEILDDSFRFLWRSLANASNIVPCRLIPILSDNATILATSLISSIFLAMSKADFVPSKIHIFLYEEKGRLWIGAVCEILSDGKNSMMS